MPTEADPIVGQWYEHRDKGQKLVVTEIDEHDGTIGVQYFDGTLDEIPEEDWHELDVEPIEAPENWSGPLDFDTPEDLSTDVTDTTPDDWEEPARELRPRKEAWEEPPEPDTPDTDDWGERPGPEEPLEE